MTRTLARTPGVQRVVRDRGRAHQVRRPPTPAVWRPHPAVLDEHVWWIDAEDGAAFGQTVPNRGWGTGLNATLGSSGSVDTNDPLWLPGAGVGYLYIGASGATVVSVPDANNLDITGDIELVLRIAMDDWTPSTRSEILSKFNSGGGGGYALDVETGGTFRFVRDNGAQTNMTSTAAPTVTDGATLWVKVTWDADNGSGQNEAKFYTAADQDTEPSSWTQLGSTVTVAGTSSISANALNLAIGTRVGGGTTTPCKIWRVIVRNGIGGTAVLDIDMAALTSGANTSFTATTGQIVTIGHNSSGRNIVAMPAGCRPVWLFGTDDYLDAASSALLDIAATEDFSMWAVIRKWGTIANLAILARKADATTGLGYMLDTGTGGTAPRFIIGDGTNSTTATGTLTAGTLSLVAGVREVGPDTITCYVNGVAGTPVTDTTTGTLANSNTLRVGRLSGAGTAYGDQEVVAAGFIRRALTAGELYAIAQHYGATA